jgi:hypothetical protein
MWQGGKTSLKEIYEDLISIYAQLSDIHDKFLNLTWSLNNGGGHIGGNEDILPDWALNASDRIQGHVGKLTCSLWQLPEVNQHDAHKLYMKRLKEKLMLAEGRPTENNLEGK